MVSPSLRGRAHDDLVARWRGVVLAGALLAVHVAHLYTSMVLCKVLILSIGYRVVQSTLVPRYSARYSICMCVTYVLDI